jgi:protein MAK11
MGRAPASKKQKLVPISAKRIKGSPRPTGVKAEESQPKNKGKAKESLPRNFKIIAGTYEKLSYGLDARVSISPGNKLQFSLCPVFAFPAHVSCIKAVAASPQGGKWLATGSADEIIKVWDLRRRKEVGGMHHQGMALLFLKISNAQSLPGLYNSPPLPLSLTSPLRL